MLILPGTTKTGKIKDATLEGKAHYNAKTNTLTLDNVVTNESIIFGGTITIILIGENIVTGIANNFFPIGGEVDILTIEGNGSLTVQGVTKVSKLLVKDCTLYVKHIAQVGALKAVKANIIIEPPSNFLGINNMDLQGCSIAYQTPKRGYGYYTYQDVLIIQKDRGK